MPPSVASELQVGAYFALFGLLAAVLWDAFAVARILFGLFPTPPVPARLFFFPFPFLDTNRLRGIGQKSGFARGALLFLLDFLFALIAGIGFILFTYAFHDGVFRLFLLCVAALTFLFYRLTLGRLVALVTGAISFLCRTLFFYAALCVRVPLSLAFCLFSFSCRTLAYLFLCALSRLIAPLLARVRARRAQKEGLYFFARAVK